MVLTLKQIQMNLNMSLVFFAAVFCAALITATESALPDWLVTKINWPAKVFSDSGFLVTMSGTLLLINFEDLPCDDVMCEYIKDALPELSHLSRKNICNLSKWVRLVHHTIFESSSRYLRTHMD